MSTIYYTRGTAYDPGADTVFWTSDSKNPVTHSYAFYFSPTLEDIGYAPFAVLENTTRGTSLADLDLTASDFAYFLDFSDHVARVRLNGGENDDILYGGRNHDTLLGDDGDDQLSGGRGNDRMEGGDGDDVYLVEDAGDRVLEAHGLGTDRVYALVDHALGAGQEVEFLYAATFSGLKLTGNEFDQSIIGANGKDVLTGLGGRDVLTGNEGADLFVYTSLYDSTVATRNRDVITDFSEAEGDRIDLRAIDAITSARGNQSFTFIGNKAFGCKAGELQSKVSGANTLVSGDVDGNGSADFAILLKGQLFLDKGDFLL